MSLQPINLSDFVTFSRSTAATRVNSAGLIETVGAGVMRIDHDPMTLAPLGFLSEGASTNLLLRSADFSNASWTKDYTTIAANAGLSPDSTMTASLMTEDTTANTYHRAYQLVSFLAGGSTFSFFAKPNGRVWLHLFAGPNAIGWINIETGATHNVPVGVTLTRYPYANGWYRIEGTFSATAGAGNVQIFLAPTQGVTSYTGDGVSGVYLWGAQFENLPFASSYIPTTTSQVTRSIDNFAIIGANFSRWCNTSEGTFIAEYRLIGASNLNGSDGRRIIEIQNESPSPSDRIGIFNSSPSRVAMVADDNGVQVAVITSGGSPVPSGTRIKIAAGYAENNFALAVDGALVGNDTNGGPPNNAIKAQFGISMFGHIKSIKFIPKRVSDAQLQELSA